MSDARTPGEPSGEHSFAHASEAEFARILDFYQVSWEYEAQIFPILWDLEGNVLESFAPDFYLPDLELFVELTTLQQRLVRKKNRKVRRLRELYPNLRIKLFYARDFRALMLKYGRSALVSELSGTLGQVGLRPPADGDSEPAGTVSMAAASTPRTLDLSTSAGASAPDGSASHQRRSRSARRRAVRRAAAEYAPDASAN